MQIVQEYMRRAEECRRLVQLADSEEMRAEIEKICKAWDMLAQKRREMLDRKKPEPAN